MPIYETYEVQVDDGTAVLTMNIPAEDITRTLQAELFGARHLGRDTTITIGPLRRLTSRPARYEAV